METSATGEFSRQMWRPFAEGMAAAQNCLYCRTSVEAPTTKLPPPSRSGNRADTAAQRTRDARPYGENRRIAHKTAGLQRPKPPLCKGRWHGGAMPEGLTIPQSRFASQLRVAAKPSRPALRPAKVSGCPTAAVAYSATGGAPLQATSTRAAPAASLPKPEHCGRPFALLHLDGRPPYGGRADEGIGPYETQSHPKIRRYSLKS